MGILSALGKGLGAVAGSATSPGGLVGKLAQGVAGAGGGPRPTKPTGLTAPTRPTGEPSETAPTTPTKPIGGALEALASRGIVSNDNRGSLSRWADLAKGARSMIGRRSMSRR